MEPEKRKGIKQSLRYAILQRDAFACCLCGRNAREDGVKLEVDHRISVAEDGTNHPNNLWTLCFDCNRGKYSASLALEYTPPPLVIKGHSKSKRSRVGTTIIYARINPDICEILKQMADEQDCSISDIVEDILRLELEKIGKLPKTA